MNSQEYIYNLKNSWKEYFDIFEDYDMYGENLSIYAKSFVRNERYIASKKSVIDAYENHEHCIVKSKDEIANANDIINFANFLKSLSEKIVTPDDEHMSTIINGIYICNKGFSDETIKIGKKFKCHKTFAFGLKGFCDVRLFLIDLTENKLYTNRDGKAMKSFYQSILEKSE